MNPEFVVIKPNTVDLRGQPKVLLDEILRNQYALTQEIDGRKIFRIKKSNALLPASQVAGSGTSY